MQIDQLYKIYLEFPNIQTDSRKIKKGDLFFALKGPNFNANLFVQQVLEDGAAYAVVDEKYFESERLILVDDVLFCLQELARYHRELFDIPFIAITGSNGKTTTKELIHCVLSTKYKTHTTKGNLNNHIGIPLTLLQIKKGTEIAVIEMGANHLGEIKGYCRYVQPTIGIITNCGKAHLEGFGSELGVRKAKGELYDYLRANQGKVIAFDDYPYLHEMVRGIEQVIWYGTKQGNLTGNAFQIDPYLQVEFSTENEKYKQELLKTNLVGGYNLPNVLCAVAVGIYFDVPLVDIRSSLEGYLPSNSRSQLVYRGSNEIILDAYNANPTSMRFAIENMIVNHAENKILILGAMKELGEASIREHQQIIEFIDEYLWKMVILIGAEFQKFANSHTWFENVQSAKTWFWNQQYENCLILIKGSRSVALEQLLEN